MGAHVLRGQHGASHLAGCSGSRASGAALSASSRLTHTLVATKRAIAYQLAQEMERANISQSELARRMKTSRSSVERLLDPANPSVTLVTLERAASAIGKRLKVQLTA